MINGKIKIFQILFLQQIFETLLKQRPLNFIRGIKKDKFIQYFLVTINWQFKIIKFNVKNIIYFN